MAEKINIEGREIAIKSVNNQDYISLTDMAKQREDANPKFIVRNWLRNNNTLLFLNAWELQNNTNFKVAQMGTFRLDVQDNSRMPSVKRYIEMTDAIGIISKSGRYGGTYAHRDIAFEFATWLSPVFKLNLITEFQRLRSEEYQRQRIEWDAGRELARLNYPIQTEAIKQTTGSLKEKQRGGAYASEADLINMLVFNMTAKQWRASNPDAKGNIRDSASTVQNTMLANLESFNAELIRNGTSREARERALGKMAEFQEKVLGQKYLPE